MIGTTEIQIGRSPKDGSEVFLSPENGPLLIFGASGSGKTLTIKKLVKRTAEVGAGPFLAYDAYGSRYADLARTLDGPGDGAGVEHVALSQPDLLGHGPKKGSLVVSDAGGRLGGRVRAGKLYEEMVRSFREEPLPHLFLDGVDEFVTAESAHAFVQWHWRSARTRGLLAASVVHDTLGFVFGERGSALTRLSRSVLFLKMRGDEAPRLVERIGPSGDARGLLDPELLVAQDTGCGVLYDRAAQTATAIRVELAEGELELFDTRPFGKRGGG